MKSHQPSEDLIRVWAALLDLFKEVCPQIPKKLTGSCTTEWCQYFKCQQIVQISLQQHIPENIIMHVCCSQEHWTWMQTDCERIWINLSNSLLGYNTSIVGLLGGLNDVRHWNHSEFCLLRLMLNVLPIVADSDLLWLWLLYSIFPSSICMLWLMNTSLESTLQLKSEIVYWTCWEMCSLWSLRWSQLNITEVSLQRAPSRDIVQWGQWV